MASIGGASTLVIDSKFPKSDKWPWPVSQTTERQKATLGSEGARGQSWKQHSDLIGQLGLVGCDHSQCTDLAIRFAFAGRDSHAVFTNSAFVFSRFDSIQLSAMIEDRRQHKSLRDIQRTGPPSITIDLRCFAPMFPGADAAFWVTAFGRLLALTVEVSQVDIAGGAEGRAILVLGEALGLKSTFRGAITTSFEAHYPRCSQCHTHQTWSGIFRATSSTLFCGTCCRKMVDPKIPGILHSMGRALLSDTSQDRVNFFSQSAAGEIQYFCESEIIRLYGPVMERIFHVRRPSTDANYFKCYCQHIDEARVFLKNHNGMLQRCANANVRGQVELKTNTAVAPVIVDEPIQFVSAERANTQVVSFCRPNARFELAQHSDISNAFKSSCFWFDECQGVFADEMTTMTQRLVQFVLANGAELRCDLEFLTDLGLHCLLDKDAEWITSGTGETEKRLVFETQIFRLLSQANFLSVISLHLSRRTAEMLLRDASAILPCYEVMFPRSAGSFRVRALDGLLECGICGSYGSFADGLRGIKRSCSRHAFCAPCLQKWHRQTEPGQLRARALVLLQSGRRDLDGVLSEAMPHCCGAVSGGSNRCVERVPEATLQTICPEIAEVRRSVGRRLQCVERGERLGYRILECPVAECFGVGYAECCHIGLCSERVQCWVCSTTFYYTSMGTRATRTGLGVIGLVVTCHAGAIAGCTAALLLVCGAYLTCAAFEAAVYKRCPRCGAMTQKDGGCDHLTCRCGARWNWSTGMRV